MMEPFERIDIQELPLSVPAFRRQVEDFLGSNGLRLGEVDLYMAVLDGEGGILAGGGLQRDIIKCLAVSPAARSLGLSVPLISRLISIAADRGFTAVKVFTKPENRPMFESLGFKLLASAPKAILMENGRGLEDYCAYLHGHRSGAVVVGAGVEGTTVSGQVAEVSVDGSGPAKVAGKSVNDSGCAKVAGKSVDGSGPAKVAGKSVNDSGCAKVAGKSGEVGVIVMNANPFTLGHRYLVEQAAGVISSGARGAEARNIVVIPVKEDASRFPYEERLEMIRKGSGDVADVVEGSDYQISAATFPTYFLKDLSDAAETQMRLDIDLFGRHIAPALGATVRFVGSEPTDPLTARYNELMKELLPSYGVRLVEIPRLKLGPSTGSGTELLRGEIAGQARDEGKRNVGPFGEPVTASRVRALLDEGWYRGAAGLTPASTWPFLLAELAGRALRMEVETPMKPGLVGPDGKGAHGDMDIEVMRKGIAAIRPFFPRMAQAGSPEELRRLGIEAERAMLAATGGVNTHRGAIFALGLALNAGFRLLAAESGLAEGAESKRVMRGTPARLAEGVSQAAEGRRMEVARLAEGVSLAAEGRRMEVAESERVMQSAFVRLAESISGKSLMDSTLHSTPRSHGAAVVEQFGVQGARQMALGGYQTLFESWLPFYRSVKADDFGLQKTLLKIMSELDDTCVIHRAGYDRAQQVKGEAKALLEEWEIAGQAGNDENKQAGNDEGGRTGSDGTNGPDGTNWAAALKDMCTRYAAEGVSPGGAADMLALTIFMESILH